MTRLAAGLIVSWVMAAVPPAAAQDLSVVMGAMGRDEAATAHSGVLLEAVRTELERSMDLTVRDTVQEVRAELPPSAVFGRAWNLGATGAAVIEFHRTDEAGGYAHLWVSRFGGDPVERIEPVPDAARDITIPARRFAASVLATLSRGAYQLLEVHVFTWPREVSVSVGGAPAVVTSRPGRAPGEGFNLWTGVVPAGTVEVRLTKPGYDSRIIMLDVAASGRDLVRLPIEASLTPSVR